MIVYHGTTERRARRICAEGLIPKKPSRRVWFAETRAYALRRARTQARRARDRPVVLTCEVDIGKLRAQFGRKRVFQRHGVIAVDGKLPVTVLRSYPAADQPSTPEDLAAWANQVLDLKAYKGVSRKHPGIDRLSSWVVHRMAERPRSSIRTSELLGKAREFLPEYFEDYVIDPQCLQATRRYRTIKIDLEPALTRAHEQEAEALECLDDPKARRRKRGLRLLAELDDPDLFDWCLMCLDDPAVDVQVAALRTMRLCKEGEPGALMPLAECEDKRVRAAAIAALARFSGEDEAKWVKLGLQDPSPCVRVETASLLRELDPREHRSVFQLALHDPNPDIAHRAERLTVGKGYHKSWARARQQ